jgi:hypothetical protein
MYIFNAAETSQIKLKAGIPRKPSYMDGFFTVACDQQSGMWF